MLAGRRSQRKRGTKRGEVEGSKFEKLKKEKEEAAAEGTSPERGVCAKTGGASASPTGGVVGLDGGCHEGFFVRSGSWMVAVQPCVALLKVLVGAAFALGSLASIMEELDSISFSDSVSSSSWAVGSAWPVAES